MGEGVIILKDVISGPFNYIEQNDYPKILIRCVWGNGRHGRRRQSPSNHFWLLEKVLALSISNRISCFRGFYDNKWQSQNFYQIYFGKIRGRVIHPPITLDLKKGTRNSDYQSKEHLRSLYDHLSCIYLICLQGVTQPLPWGLWGLSSSKK